MVSEWRAAPRQVRGVGGDFRATSPPRDPESTHAHVALDVLASVRSTALITLVVASFSSPIVLKSEAVGAQLGKLTGGSAKAPHAEPPESLVAGGVQFEMPATWGRLGATAVGGGGERDSSRIGTVVSGICPGGSAGSTCTDRTRLTFVVYSGKDGHQLPLLTEFAGQLDARLATEYRGFRKADAKMRPGADGIRYLDYTFTWGHGRHGAAQRIAAFRHEDGSGVVVLGTGPKLAEHAAAIDGFLATAHEPGHEPGHAH